MATLKTCFKCGISKERTEFYSHPRMGDGLLGKCKECTKMDVAAHRVINLEKVRAYDRERASQPHRREQAAKIEIAYRTAYPERQKATNAVNNAVRDGKLKRQPCWVCGGKAVAHHPDYSRPLDVVWLCQAHHKQTHALVSA